MVSEILSGIYVISRSFYRRRVKSVDQINLYVIKGPDRYLLIDTGLNEEQYYTNLLEDLREIGCNAENTDLFVTHYHPDHSGLLTQFSDTHHSIFTVEEEANVINQLHSDDYWYRRYQQYAREGLPMTFQEMKDSHPNCDFFPDKEVRFTIVKDGDLLEIGDYSFKVIKTPGHSPGSSCLYDENKQILLCADVILSHVVPVLFFEEGMDNPLENYLDSLDRLEKLSVKTLLPCHGKININMYDRIGEIRDHYWEDYRTILEILIKKGPMTAWQAAEHTTQLKISRTLESISPVSRWFFFLPTCVELRYLYSHGLLKAEQDSRGRLLYSISESALISLLKK